MVLKPLNEKCFWSKKKGENCPLMIVSHPLTEKLSNNFFFLFLGWSTSFNLFLEFVLTLIKHLDLSLITLFQPLARNHVDSEFLCLLKIQMPDINDFAIAFKKLPDNEYGSSSTICSQGVYGLADYLDFCS